MPLAVHKHGSGSVFLHLSPREATSPVEPLLGIVHHQLLAEGIDEALGAATDAETVGADGVEADGVANLVAPEATTRGDDHGIIAVRLHLPKRNDAGLRLSHLLDGDELIEDIVVEHEE